MALFSALCIVFVLSVIYLIRKRDIALRQKYINSVYTPCQPPRRYPHKEPILGADLLLKTVNLIKKNRNLEALAERHDMLGKTYVVNSIGQNVFHTTDPENFKAVYGTNWRDWGVSPAREDALQPFCGRGMINTDGTEWRRVRDMTKPAFTEVDPVNFTSFGQALDDILDKLPKDGGSVDMAPLLYDFFLDTAGEFLVGQRLSKVSDGEYEKPPVTASKFLDAFHGGLSWMIIRVFFGVIGRNLPNSRFRANCRTTHSFVDHYVELAMNRKKREASKASTSQCKVDTARRYGMVGTLSRETSDRDMIRSQVLQCIMCMQETTSSLVSNTIFLLSRHPEMWKRLRQVVIEKDLRGVTLKELKAIKLIQNILKESLRMYPIFCTSGRTSLRDTVLPRGGGADGSAPVFVPIDSRIITLFYGLHRDPLVFGEDVETFRPDRWDDVNPGPWEYLPFSNGPRVCAGQEKAMGEAGYVIARIAQRFAKLESRDDREWAGQWALTVKNANGCKVAFFTEAKDGLVNQSDDGSSQ